jgi:hypothetical protein
MEEGAARAELTGFLSTKSDADGLVGALRDFLRDIFDLSSVNELCDRVNQQFNLSVSSSCSPSAQQANNNEPPCRSVIPSTAPSWIEAVARIGRHPWVSGLETDAAARAALRACRSRRQSWSTRPLPLLLHQSRDTVDTRSSSCGGTDQCVAQVVEQPTF